MEADWSVEVGPHLAVIDGEWPGFVDLRGNRKAAERIPEAQQHRALEEALAASEIDPPEFDCAEEDARTGLACYIDVLAREPVLFASFRRQEAWAQAVVDRLRGCPVARGRVDVVVRGARAAGEDGFGITLYAAGCGRDSAAGQTAWEGVLRAAITATINEAEILPLR